ncbi:phage portal protein [Bradyrhizobium sp. SZCCHNS3002]|uniref:phage portal protein n=1 Tax=Bradyrhizobium sp. SZCCHNS3002 TaxID=3057310 RepID=UPI0028E26D93|nr:phage portal protein [Bradyrhizobium sp. SZCCHNS3002]
MSKLPAVRPTMIDRVVMHFAPAKGLQRLKARALLANAGHGYDGASRTGRFMKRWVPLGGSADADTLPDLPTLRARSRDLVRNEPIATGAIATRVTNVVGEGLCLQASIDHEVLGITEEQADAYERENEREWQVFCRTADLSGVQHLDELAALCERSAAESGDTFVFRRYKKRAGDVYGTKLQLIEADRVCNPKGLKDGKLATGGRLAGGLKFDDDGMPVSANVLNRHPGNITLAEPRDWQEIPFRTRDGRQTAIHLFERLRPEQTRGVPYLAPIIEHLHKLGKYSDAEVSAAVVSAMYTLIIETPQDEDGAPIAGEKSDDLNDNEVSLGVGAAISLAPGEKASFANPSRPNPQFDAFYTAFLRQIGVALELPFELLIKHFTASYSASRAALEMAWQFFRRRRASLARNFYHVVYSWMMEEAVASGRLDRPGFFDDPVIREAWLGAEWIGPSRASLNPYQEAQADALDIETGVKTREQVCMERTGGEVEKKISQLGKEQRMRDEAGLGAPAASSGSQPQQQNGNSAANEPDADDAGDAEDETQPAKKGARTA